MGRLGGALGAVLQEAGDARGLEQQRLVVLHQEALVACQVLQVLDQLGALRMRQWDTSETPPSEPDPTRGRGRGRWIET